jgi:hypothetical protein
LRENKLIGSTKNYVHVRALEELMCKELQKYIFGISEYDFIYSPLYAIISNYSHMK